MTHATPSYSNSSNEDICNPIHTRTFDNGLTVLLEPMLWLPSVSFTLLLPFGAVYDKPNEQGGSAILHDWMTRSAGGKDAKAMSNELDGLGVQRGGGPGKESSTLSASVLVDVLPQVLELYAQRVKSPELNDTDFAAAKTLALEEYASLADSPSTRMFIDLTRAFFASAHKQSSYGTEESLANITADRLREFYKRHVTPQGAILALAGGISWEQLEPLLEPFADWQGESVEYIEAAVNPAPAQPLHISEDTVQTHIGIRSPLIPPQDRNWYNNSVAGNVLSGGMGSRLFSEVREKRGLVYSVYAAKRVMRKFASELAYAGTTPERAQETLDVVMAEILRLKQGVSADELERAKIGLLSSLVMQGEVTAARAGALARGWHIFGEARTTEMVKAAVNACTLESVNTYLANRSTPEYTVMCLGQKAVKMPKL